MLYYALLTVHLLCAMAYFGTVFYRTFIADPVLSKDAKAFVDEGTLNRLEKLFGPRTRPKMRIAIVLLLASGIGMLHTHGATLAAFDSGFAQVLALKVTLGVLVITLFFAMPRIQRATPDEKKAVRHRRLHYLIFTLLLLIVLCAKGMYMV